MSTADAPKVDLDAASAELQKAASDVINQASATGEDAKATAGSKREAILNVANIVKDQAHKGLDSSKVLLEKVMDKVGTYAQQATDKASTQFEGLQSKATEQLTGLQGNLAKAIKAGQTPGSSSAAAGTAGTTDRSFTPAEDGSGGNEAMKFPFNVVTWCSSVCGGKDGAPPTIAGRGISIDSLRQAAATVQSTLESEVSAATQQAQAAAQSAQEQATAAASKAKETGQEALQQATEKAQAAGDQA